MGRIKKKMQRGCMTIRILGICASVATETGLFSVYEAKKKMKKVYPEFFKLYSSKFVNHLSAAKHRGSLEEVFIEGLRATGLYRIPYSILEQVEEFIV
jgi:hypothetical protein